MSERSAGDSVSPGDSTHAKRLRELSQGDEEHVLNWILEQGVDQGWFIRAGDSDLVSSTLADQEGLIQIAQERPSVRPSISDPFPTFDYPVHTISGSEPGFIVSSQKCDIVQTIRKEPFIELVRTSLSRNPALISSARKNSPRFSLIADADGGAWIADLRIRCYLPKDLIITLPGLHVIDSKRRQRLVLQLGDRYSRNPVPTDLVIALQDPLIKFLQQPECIKLAGPFADWRCIRHGDKVELIAITGVNRDRIEAEDAFDQLLRAMPKEIHDCLDEDTCRVVLVEELPFHLWNSSCSLDLDEVTYGKRGEKDPGQSPPIR